MFYRRVVVSTTEDGGMGSNDKKHLRDKYEVIGEP